MDHSSFVLQDYFGYYSFSVSAVLKLSRGYKGPGSHDMVTFAHSGMNDQSDNKDLLELARQATDAYTTLLGQGSKKTVGDLEFIINDAVDKLMSCKGNHTYAKMAVVYMMKKQNENYCKRFEILVRTAAHKVLYTDEEETVSNTSGD